MLSVSKVIVAATILMIGTSSVMSMFYVQALRNWSLFLQSFVPTTTYWNIKSNTVFQFTFRYKKKTNSSEILYSQ